MTDLLLSWFGVLSDLHLKLILMSKMSSRRSLTSGCWIRKRRASQIKHSIASGVFTCRQVLQPCFVSLLSCRSQARDVFAGRRTRPVQAGARPSGQQLKKGSSQATEGLITDPGRGQPCGNCVQLTEGTGRGGRPCVDAFVLFLHSNCLRTSAGADDRCCV